MFYRKESFSISKKEQPIPIATGVLFAFSSLFLFESYNHMDSGIASTILFVYPVFVTAIMATYFAKKYP